MEMISLFRSVSSKPNCGICAADSCTNVTIRISSVYLGFRKNSYVSATTCSSPMGVTCHDDSRSDRGDSASRKSAGRSASALHGHGGAL